MPTSSTVVTNRKIHPGGDSSWRKREGDCGSGKGSLRCVSSRGTVKKYEEGGTSTHETKSRIKKMGKSQAWKAR